MSVHVLSFSFKVRHTKRRAAIITAKQAQALSLRGLRVAAPSERRHGAPDSGVRCRRSHQSEASRVIIGTGTAAHLRALLTQLGPVAPVSPLGSSCRSSSSTQLLHPTGRCAEGAAGRRACHLSRQPSGSGLCFWPFAAKASRVVSHSSPPAPLAGRRLFGSN